MNHAKSRKGLFKRSPGYRDNYNTLLRAAANKDLALMACTDRTTGKDVAVLCAVQPGGEGTLEFVPLAKLFDGNPYDELLPPGAERAA
jgi:hypothetical protein